MRSREALPAANRDSSRRVQALFAGKIQVFLASISQFYRDKVAAGRAIAARRPCENCVIVVRLIRLFINSLAAQTRRMRRDRGGFVAILVALALPVVAGFAALAVDTSMWSSAQNSAQGAADNAALSAVVAAGAGSSSSQIANEAQASSVLNGFANGQNGVTVIVNNPPKSGPNKINGNAYEVIVTQPQKLFFGKLLGNAPTVIGRAVALVPTSPPCILALDPSASGAITMNGGASVGSTKCGVAANSSSATAGNFSGGASLTAANFNVVGNYSTSGGATVAATIKTGAPATADPYKSLAVPPYYVCNSTPFLLSGGKPAILLAGVDCGDISVSGGSNLTMNPGAYSSITVSGGSTLIMTPGIYTIYGSLGFNLSGGTTTTAIGVSIVLTNNGSSGWGTIDISGGATFTLTAPSSGPMQGVAFYVDRKAPPGSDRFSGSSMAITGSLYLPSQAVSYSGSLTPSACLQLIADTVSFSAGSSFGVNCGSLTVPGLQLSGKGIPAE